MTEKEPLMTLKTQADGRVETPRAAAQAHATRTRANDSLPLLGLFAVGFGLLGIFTFAPVFAPLALVFGLIALFTGQIMLGLTAVVLSVAGVLSSPTMMVIMGVGALAAWLGIPI